MKNQEVNIMVVANRKYINPMVTMLCSLFKNNVCPIRVFMFYSDFDDAFLDQLHIFFSKWQNKSVVPIRMELSEVLGLPVTDELPLEIYYKMQGLDMLPRELYKVYCMDLDMVCTKPLDELFKLDISGYSIAACKDVYAYVYGEGVRNLKRLHLPEQYHYFNAGMMCFNLDRIREYGGGKALITYCYEHADLLKWPEQDILNKVFQESYLELPWARYNCPPIMYIMKSDEVMKGVYEPLCKEQIQKMDSFDGFADYTQAIADNASIIHYIGESKPWRNSRPVAKTYEIFDRFYEEYKVELS